MAPTEGSLALAIVTPFPTRPRRAPVDWRIIGDTCQKIAAEGGDLDGEEWLNSFAKRAVNHLAQIRAAKALLKVGAKPEP